MEPTNLPTHVGIIMDGNGRWAARRGLPRSMGHKAGFENFKKLVPYILNQGIFYLSVYAFSKENFKRSKEEVNYLMNLFCEAVHKEKKLFEKENIKVLFSGRKEPLKEEVWQAMQELVDDTKNNTKGILNVCLNYGGQDEIVDAAMALHRALENEFIKESEVNAECFAHYLYQDIPPLDFVIRTSGEKRISNFMLYQSAYAEYYFPEVLFPDFKTSEFDQALIEFSNRNRRFGGIKHDKTND